MTAKKLTPKDEFVTKNHDDIAKALEILFASDYISRRRLYWENFVRGITFGVGSLVGATVVIGVVIWILSIFDTIPVIGPYIDDTKQSIEKR